MRSRRPVEILTEVWKDIPYYEGSYQVSTLGNVRSFFIIKQRY